MQFKIHYRPYTGRDPLTLERAASLQSETYGIQLRTAIKLAISMRADLTGADLTGADLTGADLTGADLTDADLRGADLTRADLRGADLTRADLTRADLRGADLTRADLTDADLRGADIPVIPHIDAAILSAVTHGEGKLEMGNWHTCETTHCRAGWAVFLAGNAGLALEGKFGSAAAGALIYAKSRPTKRVPNFYATNDDVLADLRACAAEDPLPAE